MKELSMFQIYDLEAFLFTVVSVLISIVSAIIIYSRYSNFNGKQFLLWLILDFSGFRFICHKIRPPIGEEKAIRKDSTFFLWVIGIYVALYGVASQRYENSITKIENRANAIITQLSSHQYKAALSLIPSAQNMECPYKPVLFKPITIYKSLFENRHKYDEVIELLRDLIQSLKNNLSSVTFDGVNLKKAQLNGANFHKAILGGANFESAHLNKANFNEAIINTSYFKLAMLNEANIQDAKLIGAIMIETQCIKTNFKSSFLRKTLFLKSDLAQANFHDSVIIDSVFSEVRGLTSDQLCRATTLCGSKLDPDLLEDINNNCPNLLKCPKGVRWGIMFDTPKILQYAK